MERSKSIDLLRAIALFLVCFGRHLAPCPPGPGFIQMGAHYITTILAQGGWIGVDIFFVLSGFLVSGLLFSEQQRFGLISGKRFLIRRGFKIYPAFWLLIVATIVVRGLVDHDISGRAIASEIAFVQNYGPFLWWHTWSLAVEEHFYILLLAFLLYLSRHSHASSRFSSLPLCFFVLAMVCLGMRLLTARAFPFEQKLHMFPSHLRMDSLFFGALLSYFYHFHPLRFMAVAKRFRGLFFLCGIALLAPAFFYPQETSPFIYTLGLTGFYLGSGCLLMAGMATNIPQNPPFKLAIYIGSHSYSIYLWHAAVAEWIVLPLSRNAGAHWSWPLYAMIYFISTLVVGVAMALIIEFPTLRFRDRYFPSRSRSLFVKPKRHFGAFAPLTPVAGNGLLVEQDVEDAR